MKQTAFVELPKMLPDDFRTPDWLFDRLDQEFAFTWDLACTRNNCRGRLGCGYYFDEEYDGLAEDWRSQKGPLWLNPPYSETGKWVAKAAQAVRESGETIVALVPADPGARWWSHVLQATQIRFLRHRLDFTSGSGKIYHSRVPSAVVVWSQLGGPPAHLYISR